MKKNIILIKILLLCTHITYTDNLIGKWVKQWVTRSFGIDANEPLILKPFEPNIENLHTVTLIPNRMSLSEQSMTLSVSDLAHTIDKKQFSEQLYLQLNTQENVIKTWQVKQGICVNDEHETLFVYSRGYAGAERPEEPQKADKRAPRGMCAIPKRGGSVVVGAQWLKHHIINGSCIMFDYPDTRSFFDFGLKNDQKCLDVIYENVVSKTNNIVFFGNCRGSKSLLNFLSKSRPDNVKAVILDAPFLDLLQFTQEIGKNYAKRIPFSKDIAYKIITYWHPNYTVQDDLHLSDLVHIPKHIPIFIGHLYHDALVSDYLIKNVVQTLRNSGHTVYVLVINDPTKSHSRLYQTEPFAKAANAFLKKYKLPHDAQLARSGKFLLNNAAYAAKHIDNWPSEGFPYVFKSEKKAA